MLMRRLARSGLALLVLSLAGFGAWVWSLPAPAVAAAAPVPQREMNAMLASLKPPKRARPLIAVIGINDATETTDYLVPTGILRRADVADVVMVAAGPGPVRLYPALTVKADATIADFDARNPEGADYVVVPAMSRDDDPAVLAWLQRQARTGAIIIGVCAGAKVVGAAGLLEGKRATTHWYFLGELRDRNPSMRYVADRRFVVDDRIVTTTGITASMPMTLTLIEAIAGRGKAATVARELGLPTWDARHASGAFRLNRPFVLTVMGNTLAFWNREQLDLRLAPGVDEVSLALIADAWSRTYKSRVETFAPGAVETRNGVRILPDRNAEPARRAQALPAVGADSPAEVLDATLRGIAGRYGPGTADVVALQLEYRRRAS